jgi:hypothetical protein
MYQYKYFHLQIIVIIVQSRSLSNFKTNKHQKHLSNILTFILLPFFSLTYYIVDFRGTSYLNLLIQQCMVLALL